MKNRILIFADYFLPGFRAGGPILSLSLLHENLREDFDAIIATRNRDFGESKPYREVEWDRLTKFGNYSVHYLSRLGLLRILGVIRNARPQAIYLNSFFSAFTRLVLLLKKAGLVSCPVILAPRGELSGEALAIKGWKKKPFLALVKALHLEKDIVFHATDASEEADIRKLFRVKTHLLPNFSRQVQPEEFPLPDKEKGSLRLVFLSRITEKKNLLKALEILAAGGIRGDVLFSIYGPIENQDYWQDCLALSRSLPPNIRFEYAGVVESKDVLDVLSRYHALLLPTRNENYGHAIVEAMKLGLIPIISDRTPWRKLNEFNAGWDLPLNATEAFADAVQKVTEMDQMAFSASSGQARKFILQATENARNKEKYRSLFQGLTGGSRCDIPALEMGK